MKSLELIGSVVLAHSRFPHAKRTSPKSIRKWGTHPQKYLPKKFDESPFERAPNNESARDTHVPDRLIIWHVLTRWVTLKGTHAINWVQFLGAFIKLRKATISFVISVRMEQFVSYWTNFDEIWYFCFCFENMSRKFKFNSNPTRTTGTLHEDVSTFTTISWWILLRINISDKSCRENQNTYFMFNNVFPKIVLFMR
jgi:hypothetical protein